MVCPDDRVNQFMPDVPELLQRAVLVCSHQARISRHISDEDRGETADCRHCSPGRKVRLTNSTPKFATALAREWRSLSLQFYVRTYTEHRCRSQVRIATADVLHLSRGCTLECRAAGRRVWRGDRRIPRRGPGAAACVPTPADRAANS